MAASIVLVSRFPVSKENISQALNGVLDNSEVRYLLDLEQTEILQLRSFKNINEFSSNIEILNSDVAHFTPYMIADVRRELLTYIEAPKETQDLLIQSDYIQLRHVEVPPQRAAAYRKWREETIFQVVRESDEIDAFLAYHSLVSGQPGVMFITGFSCPLDKYTSVFSSDRYKEIVQQAGDNYITGGKDGLYTKIYYRPQLEKQMIA